LKLRIAAALAPLAVVLAACSATAPGIPTPSVPAPSASISTPAPVTSSPAPSARPTSGADTARAAADRIATAVTNSDEAAFCADYAQAKYRVLCQKYMTDVHGHLVVHRVVVRGDRALASMTGQLCTAVSTAACQQVTDPTKGMPSKQFTFAQAYAQAVSDSQAADEGAAVPLMRVGGRWYLDGQ